MMGYYDGSTLPMWQWAKEYTLADNFFMGAFGGSYLNHSLAGLRVHAARRRTCRPRAARATRRARLAEATARVRRRRRLPVRRSSSRRIHARRLLGQHDAAALAAFAACRRRRAAIRAHADPAKLTSAAADAAKTIGDTLSRQGRLLGVVCGRMERRRCKDGMQPPGGASAR